MNFDLRPEFDGRLNKIVIKVGSAALASGEGDLSPERVANVVRGCERLMAQGVRTILVSSGAILAGRSRVPRREEPDVIYQQATSAIGQPLLMRAYGEEFRKYGRTSAQVLLTHEDIRSHHRALNLKNTIHCLLDAGVVPIINENDSVSFEEITVGDNDQLAAMVAGLLEVDGLVLLTTPDGLYDQDPGAGGAAVKIPHVHYRERFDKVSVKGISSVGRGGMETKLQAVRKVTPLGIPVIVATFRNDDPVIAALSPGGGTFFEAPDLSQAEEERQIGALASLNLALKDVDS